MKMSKSSINLFRSRKKGFFEKFLKWALGIGRFVVIVTETVALVAFIYRFSLDRELIDLHDDIKSRQAIVKLLKDNEDAYRSLQARLELAKNFTDVEEQTSTIFSDINSFVSNDISITKLLLSENQVKIDAQMQSVSSLTNFVKMLKTYDKIKSVSIDRLENRTTNAIIIVSITATLKKSTAVNLTTNIQ